jgi:amino acid permease
MKTPVTTSVAIGVGLVVMAGYFIPLPLLQNTKSVLLDWGIIVTGAATLVGLLNLVGVHWRKINAPKEHNFYSVIFILAFLFTLAAGLVFGANNTYFQKIVSAVQIPVETTLLALVPVVLIYALIRYWQRKKSLTAAVFILSVLFFLLVSSGLLTFGLQIPVIQDVVSIIQRLPLAGGRGILIGVALGSILTGLRILMGIDRPYSG